MLSNNQVIDNLKILVEEEKEKSVLMGYKRTKWTIKTKKKIIEDCENSNMTKDKFFKALEIEPTFYHYWKKQFKAKDEETVEVLLEKILNLEKELENTRIKAKEKLLKKYNLK